MFALLIVVLLPAAARVRPVRTTIALLSLGIGATFTDRLSDVAICEVKTIRFCPSSLQMPRKSDFVLGLETVLNNPQTSFMKNPKVFNELYKQTGMTMNAMMKHIGKGSKNKKQKEPTDAEKSEARLDRMEAQTNK